MSIEYPSQRVSDVYSAIYQLDSVTICSFCSMQHEITGCDTTSAHYGQGKKKAFKLLLKYPDLRKCVDVFNDPSTSECSGVITFAGEGFLVAHYGTPRATSCMNKARYHCFTKSAGVPSIKICRIKRKTPR